MYRLGLVAAALLAGCVSSNPMKAAPTVLRDVDFKYDSIWLAATGAVQTHFPDLDSCNKADMAITSFFRPEPDIDITQPHEYARRAFLTIKLRETPDGPRYDIEVRVGKYWRARSPLADMNEGWDLIRWDRELEGKIIEEFKKHTVLEQRLRQGQKEFEKQRSRGY